MTFLLEPFRLLAHKARVYFSSSMMIAALVCGFHFIPSVPAAAASSFSLLYGDDGFDFFSDVKLLRNGGYVAVGHTNSKGQGNYDGWIVKTDSSGKIVSERTLGNKGRDFLTYVHQLTDGGFFLVGRKDNGTSASATIWLLRLNGDLSIDWQKQLDSGRDPDVNDVTFLSDNSFILAGSIKAKNSKSSSAFFKKFSIDGTLIWEHLIEGKPFAAARSVVAGTNGMLHAVIKQSEKSFGVGESTFITLDGSGTETSRANLLEPAARNLDRAVLLDNGELLFGGSIKGRNTADYDVELIRMDADGTVKWVKLFGGAGRDTLSDLTVLSNGTIMVAADTESKGAGGSDFWFVNINGSGDQIWDAAIGNKGDDGVKSLVALPDGGIAAVGWNQEASKDAVLLAIASKDIKVKKPTFAANSGSSSKVDAQIAKQADLCRREKDKKARRSACVSWVKAAPNLPEAYYARALAYQANFDRKFARADVSDAIRLKPDYAEALVLRGKFLLRDGKKELAETDLRKAIAARPNSSFAYQELSSLLLRNDDVDQALSVAIRGLKAFPFDPRLHVNRCIVFSRKKQIDKAVEACTEAIKLGGVSESALRVRGRIHTKANRPQEALKDYTTFLKLDPEDKYMLQKRADVYLTLGDKAAATRDMDRMVEVERKDLSLFSSKKFYSSALLARGQFHQKIGNVDLARRDFTEAAKIGNKDAKAALQKL